ncbi:MAG: sulfite exporter TauE/SafE family protein [Chloroflexota bacterium]|nr:sulfite exporter TauE/SafE family protein [Chloroflexota bacterium]
MSAIKGKLFKSPVFEILLMTVLMIAAYVAMGIISNGIETPQDGYSAGSILLLLFGFFLLSYVIALIAVIAGIGGGVIFTPIMLAFTSVDSLIVRATGLIVAMFSGLVSTGPFMRRGLANLKLCILLAASYGIGAFLGANGAILVADSMGESGEAFIRIILGVIVICIAGYFVWGGTKMEWPEVKKVDSFTKKLGIPLPYYEASLDKVVNYKVTRAWGGMIAIMFVGILSGFFGMGGGWAAVPAMNMIMGVPLKVAAACSGVLLGMGDCIAVWPYLLKGAIIALFAAPWLVGQVLGGITGAHLLIRIKAGFVRFILIGLLFFTSFALIKKGLLMLEVVGEVPFTIDAALFIVIAICVVLAVMGKLPNPLKRGV